MKSLPPELMYVLLFIASALGGYLVTWPLRRTSNTPGKGDKVRIRLPGGMARANIVIANSKGWTLGPIIQRHGSDLPRPGDQVVVTSVSGSKASVFRSEIVSVEGAFVKLLPPIKVYSRDRRKQKRLVPEVSMPAMLDGCRVRVIDLSLNGARVVGQSAAQRGDRLMLALPSGLIQCWVLSTEGEGDSCEIRVVFEQPLANLPKKLNCPTLG